MREDDDVEPYPARCLRAALAEAKLWGAQRVIGKGDLTDEGTEEEFEWFAAILKAADIPADLLLGNHDVTLPEVDGAAILRRRGLSVATETTAVDVPGLRIILLPSTKGAHDAQWKESDRAQALVLAAESDRPVFVATHHYAQRWNRANTMPVGVKRSESKPFLDELDRVAPGSVLAAGHTHRHHRRHHRSLLLTEIGSTKDYPGVWAGYVVYEGGITQTVRRVEDPACRVWTDRTGNAIGGIWRLWSPGIRSHRCWTWPWPVR